MTRNRRRSNATRFAAAVVGLGGGLVSPAAAQGVPVLDGSSIAQLVAQLEQMRASYQTELDQLIEMQRQYMQMRASFEAITGARGISDVLNAAGDVSARAGAEDLTSIMDTAITGADLAGTVGRMPQRLGQLRESFDLTDLGSLRRSDRALDRAIAELGGAGLTAAAVADDSYQRADAATGRLNQLIDGIDEQADLKASVDYNTRMQAEVATLLVDLIRLQAAGANASGMSALDAARDRQAAKTFMRMSEE